MDKKTFMRLYALPLDIEKRQRLIARLEQLQAAGPDTVSDTVQSSIDAGNATVLCHATVRGRDAEYERREVLIRDLRQKQIQARADYAAGVKLIESCTDASVRVTLQVVCLEGGSYNDAACEFRRRGIPKDREGLRKAAQRWIAENV